MANSKKQLILFIRDSDAMIDPINYLSKRYALQFVVFKIIDDKSELFKFLCAKGVAIISHDELASQISSGVIVKVDYIISYFYQKKIQIELLNIASKGAINFHPAPLPIYKGVGNYCRCILDELDYWAVSAHFMSELIDSGKLIKVHYFAVDSTQETYYSLELKSIKHMFMLLRQVLGMDIDVKQDYMPTGEVKNVVWTTTKSLQKLKKIDLNDAPELINKKIRAFWRPPYSGATISIQGGEYTIINEEILNLI